MKEITVTLEQAVTAWRQMVEEEEEERAEFAPIVCAGVVSVPHHQWEEHVARLEGVMVKVRFL